MAAQEALQHTRVALAEKDSLVEHLLQAKEAILTEMAPLKNSLSATPENDPSRPQLQARLDELRSRFHEEQTSLEAALAQQAAEQQCVNKALQDFQRCERFAYLNRTLAPEPMQGNNAHIRRVGLKLRSGLF